jgi:3,4-dihydroxy 2-butanone 4-phosphate synthase/GTP cyclohydrolase II
VHHDVHVALVHGDLDGSTAPLVRVQLQDTLRDLIGVRGPRLGWRLNAAMARVAQEPAGIIVILRRYESPRDLVDAVAALNGRPVDRAGPGDGEESRVLRTYGIGAQILRNLGVRQMRVLSAPKQMTGLSGFGLQVTEYVDD